MNTDFKFNLMQWMHGMHHNPSRSLSRIGWHERDSTPLCAKDGRPLRIRRCLPCAIVSGLDGRQSGWADLRSPRRGNRRPLPSTGSGNGILEILITLLCCAWKARTSGTSTSSALQRTSSRGGRTCAVLAGETDGLFLNKMSRGGRTCAVLAGETDGLFLNKMSRGGRT